MLQEDKIKLYKEIEKEIKEELGIETSLEEINSVVLSQFKIMAYGFSKGVSSHISYVGKFIPFDMDYYTEKMILPNKKLQEELQKQGKMIEAKDAFINSYRNYKKAIADKNQEPVISAQELINIPNLDGSTDNLDIFKNLR